MLNVDAQALGRAVLVPHGELSSGFALGLCFTMHQPALRQQCKDLLHGVILPFQSFEAKSANVDVPSKLN